MSLLDAMDAGWSGQGVDKACQAFLSKVYCIARDNIQCDVDENMWPNAESY